MHESREYKDPSWDNQHNQGKEEEKFKHLKDRIHAQHHVQEVESLDNLNLMDKEWESIGLVEEDDSMDKKKDVEEKSH